MKLGGEIEINGMHEISVPHFRITPENNLWPIHCNWIRMFSKLGCLHMYLKLGAVVDLITILLPQQLKN